MEQWVKCDILGVGELEGWPRYRACAVAAAATCRCCRRRHCCAATKRCASSWSTLLAHPLSSWRSQHKASGHPASRVRNPKNSADHDIFLRHVWHLATQRRSDMLCKCGDTDLRNPRRHHEACCGRLAASCALLFRLEWCARQLKRSHALTCLASHMVPAAPAGAAL